MYIVTVIVIRSKIILCQLMRIYWRAILPNFTPIRFETTEPWAFLKTLPQQQQKKKNSSSRSKKSGVGSQGVLKQMGREPKHWRYVSITAKK